MALTVFFHCFRVFSDPCLLYLCPSICRLSQACDFIVGLFSPQNPFQISRCKPNRTDPLLACYVLLRFEEVGPSPKTIFAKSVWDTRLSPVFSTFLVGHSPPPVQCWSQVASFPTINIVGGGRRDTVSQKKDKDCLRGRSNLFEPC